MKVKILKPKHEFLLQEFFLNLDSCSLNLMNRFGTTINGDNVSMIALEQTRKTIKEEIGFIALIKNKIIGYSFLRLNEQKERKHLASFGIIVLKEFQNKGIGTNLIKFTIQKAKQLKLKKIWLITRQDNFKAKNLYESFGFITEGFFGGNIKQDNKFLGEYSLALFLDEKKLKKKSLNELLGLTDGVLLVVKGALIK